MFEFNDAQLAMAIAISVFDDVFKEYFEANNLGSVDFSIDPDNPEAFTIPLQLDAPQFFMEAEPERFANGPTTFLQLTGSFENPFTQQLVPVAVKVHLGFATVQTGAEVPKLGFFYHGIVSINPELEMLLSPLIGAETQEELLQELSDLLAQNSIIQTITDVQLDIIRPLTEGLGAALFDEDSLPSPISWSVHIRPLVGMGGNRLDAIGIFIAEPDKSAFPGNNESFLIASHQMVLAYSRNFLDEVLMRGTKAQEGKEIKGAKITVLNLHMNDGSIQVNGKVKKSGVTVSFNGPMHPHLIRGTENLLVDTSGVIADVPDAFTNFLKFLAVLFAFTLPGLLNVVSIFNAIDDIEEDADNDIEDSLSNTLGESLSALAEGLKFSSEVADVEILTTTDILSVVAGNFFFFNRIFINQIVDEIDSGFYSKKLRKFVMFRLKSGMRLSAMDLAKLIGREKIVIPGVHDVGETYVRTNHDATDDNNLLELFKENTPDEPTVADIPG